MTTLFSRLMQRSSRKRSAYLMVHRYVSGVTENVEAPVLLRLRAELKTAMKARDKERLNVIKGVLANITNAEKTNQPMNSDEKIRKHLLKLAETQRATAQQFEAANREDLRDKELLQATILDGYAAEIEVVPVTALKEAILNVVSDLSARNRTGNIGDILQALKKKDGPLLGKIFDSDQAILIMKDLDISAPSSRKA